MVVLALNRDRTSEAPRFAKQCAGASIYRQVESPLLFLKSLATPRITEYCVRRLLLFTPTLVVTPVVGMANDCIWPWICKESKCNDFQQSSIGPELPKSPFPGLALLLLGRRYTWHEADAF